MLGTILIILIVLWLLGIVSFPLTGIVLFYVSGRSITLNHLLVFMGMIWLIELLPNPFRAITTVLFILWLLSVFGIIVIGNFGNIFLAALIIGLIAYLFHWNT